MKNREVIMISVQKKLIMMMMMMIRKKESIKSVQKKVK